MPNQLRYASLAKAHGQGRIYEFVEACGGVMSRLFGGTEVYHAPAGLCALSCFVERKHWQRR